MPPGKRGRGRGADRAAQDSNLLGKRKAGEVQTKEDYF